MKFTLIAAALTATVLAAPYPPGKEHSKDPGRPHLGYSGLYNGRPHGSGMPYGAGHPYGSGCPQQSGDPQQSGTPVPVSSAVPSHTPSPTNVGPVSTSGAPTPVVDVPIQHQGPRSSSPATPPPKPSTPAIDPTDSPPADFLPSTQSSNDGSPQCGSTTYLGIINKYRGLYNKALLKWDPKLVKNAQKTTDDGHGEMKHELNPGTFGQVLTPGFTGPVPETNKVACGFELSYLSWMCESQNDPQIKDLCPLVTGVDSISHMSFNSKGHYDILTSDSYKTIGCGFTSNGKTTGPWRGIAGCDLGF